MMVAVLCHHQAAKSQQPEEQKQRYEELLEVVWNYEMTRNRYKHPAPTAEQEGAAAEGQGGEEVMAAYAPWTDDQEPELLNVLTASGVEGTREHQAEVQMMVYKFQALVYLGSESAKAVQEQILALPGVTVTTCRILSSVASKANQARLAVQALKVALHLKVDEPKLDIPVVSDIMHSLVQLVAYSNSTHPDAEKESLMTFNELVSIIEAKATGSYPEMEMMWLMTKAWNKGVIHHSCQRLELAESWCALAMGILTRLPTTLKDLHQEKMSRVYGKLLSELEAAHPK